MSAADPIAQRLGSDEAELLSALMASMADAVYAVDDAGVVVFANAAALDILGYASEGDLIGRPSHATIHHSHPDGRPFPEAECPLLRPRVTGEPVRVDQDWFVRRDGSFVPVAYSSAPVTVDARRGAVVVFRDISERNRAESERLRAEAIHASRARIVQAALEERRRLGRDLHDGAQQRLINVIFALQAAGRGAGDEPARRALAEALEETQLAIRDLRDLGAGLDPSVLAHRGLAAAIASLTARTPVPVTLEVPPERFAPLIESTALLRRLRGAGQRRQARAGLRGHGADRAGARPPARDRERRRPRRGGAGPAGGSGLAGLADRVAAVGGTLVVASPAGAGTRLTAELPLRDDVSEPAAG